MSFAYLGSEVDWFPYEMKLNFKSHYFRNNNTGRVLTQVEANYTTDVVAKHLLL